MWPEASETFVITPQVQELADRALMYLQAGYPVHFSGPAGTGKTTLALHVASQLGRPVTLIHGDDEFGSSDLVGSDHGYRRSKLVDNFIHSVLKTEEEMKTLWMDNRLTTACRNGDTLIYDEFTRSRPEANNALLSVLGERILNLPKLRRNGEGYLEVHPQFRAIFTSNPEEYAGVHKTQDALMDRLITISVGHFDRATEIAVTVARSGIADRDAEVIVDIVRELRGVGVIIVMFITLSRRRCPSRTVSGWFCPNGAPLMPHRYGLIDPSNEICAVASGDREGSLTDSWGLRWRRVASRIRLASSAGDTSGPGA